MQTYVGRNRVSILLDEEDYKKFFVRGNFFSISSHGYVRCMNYIGLYDKTGTAKYGHRYLHRMVTKAPKHLVVDHINGNRLDNRKDNLRLCSDSNNALNKKERKGNKYKGIYLDKTRNKWVAQITKNYKTKNLGSFKTPEEAALVYNKYARQLHGKYAYLNIISK